MKKTLRSIISFVLMLAILITTPSMSVLANLESWEDSINTDFKQNTSSNQWEEIERNTEIILRNPSLYERIEGADLKGAEVSHDQNSRTYLLEDGTYLTRYFDEPIMFADEDGELKDIDNNLKSKGDNYTNNANAYELVLPKNGEGITIQNRGYTLELKPSFGELKNAVVLENAIRYNNVFDGIDLQYTANGNNVKEDIIINKPVDITDFCYEVNCDGLLFTVEDNTLYAYQQDDVEPIFIITAPYMTDNSGVISQAVKVSFDEDNNMLKVSPDIDWINDKERAYPIVVDPTIQLNESNLQWWLVENGVGIPGYSAGPNKSHVGNPYLYAGFERGNLTGIPGLTYGETRSYIKINYDFSTIPNGTIISAKLKAYKYAGQPAEGTRVFCQLVTSDWTGSTKCWNTKPLSVNYSNDNEPDVVINAADVSGEAKWVEWDISTPVRMWKNGTPNYGLALVPEFENQSAVCFSGPGNQHGDQAMYFDITWTVPNAVDENMALDTPVINIRPLTETTAEGKQSLNGVFADGVVRPALQVAYRLNDIDSGIYNSAEYGRIYPDSNLFNGVIPFTVGYVGLHQSNWQSKLFTNFNNNVLYNVYATATDGTNTTPEGKSDSFIVYEFTSQDTLPYIADFYGVSLEQIIADNKPQDYLGFSENTFFIRNPQKNAEIAYTRPDNLTDDQKRAIIYANLGRGLHSEFDLEPINVNIGNYYFASTDAVSSEYNGTFTFERSYNSIGTKSYGVFGNGWSFEYAQSLSGRTDGSIVYNMGDGKQLVFTKSGSDYTAPVGYDLVLKKNEGARVEDAYYTISKTDGTVYRFDCYGLLISVTDINGYATTIQYDSNYHISGILTSSGRQYVISTNTDGQIVSVTLPNGGVLKYEYENGNLVKFVNADDVVVRYVYNDIGQMTEWYDGNGSCVIKNEYDSEGRVVKQTDALGAVSTLVYDDSRTVVTNGNGEITTYYYDEQYRTTKIEGGNKEKEAEYNEDNRLSAMTENGSSIFYEYDSEGNITKEIRADGTYREVSYDEYGNAIAIREYDGSVTYNSYDINANLIKTIKPDGSTLVYTYDQYGQVTSLTDGNGGCTTFVYDGLTKMTMTDANGNVSYCYYDTMGQLVSEIDANGNETKTVYSKQGKKLGVWKTGDIYEQYLYDGNGNCIEVIDPEGYKCIFTYDAANRMLTAENPLGGVIEYKYDVAGNKTEEKDTLGNVTNYTYDSEGRLVTVIDAADRETVYTYNDYGKISTVKTPDGNETKYEYDTILGLPIKITDNFGTVVYDYDTMGRITEVIYDDGSKQVTSYDVMGNIASTTETNGLVTNYTYDKNGNLTTLSDNMGGSTIYKYDALNNLIEVENALGQKYEYSYDAVSHLISQTDAMGGTASYVYDTTGNIVEITDAKGASETYAYDKNSNCISMTDGNGNVTRYSYDGAGDLVAVIDALDNATTYSYDTAQQLIEQSNAVAQKTYYEYDLLGRVVKTTDSDGFSSTISYDSKGNTSLITAQNGSLTKYIYDDKNQLIKTETADGLVTEYEYDLMGRITKQWDNAGNVEINSYDASGNLLTKTDAIGRTAEYSYDLYGNVIKIIDFTGDVTEYEYDVLSRLTSVIEPDGRETNYTYDANGNVLTITDDDGNVYSYVYDEVSQLIKEIDPLSQETTYTYDNNGNVLSVTDAKGGVTNYTYSATNLPVSVTDALGNTKQYEYDAMGQLIKQTTAEGNTTEYLYDGRGNVIKVKNPLGHVTEHKYDSMSNLVKTISPRGAVTAYTYNNAGLQLTITDPNGSTTSNDYDFDGKLISQTLPNNLKYTYEYDTIGRITKMADSAGASIELSYNAKDKVHTETTQNGVVTSFDYDTFGRLTTVTNAKGEKTEYSYDERGNVVSVKTPAGAETIYNYDVLDRVSKVTQPLTADISYTYDELGNITDIVQGEKTVVTTYDAIGNTVSVTNPLGEVLSYTYDKDSRMTESTDFAGNSSSVSYDAAGNILSAKNALGFEWGFTYDGDGNVTKTIDAIGNVTEYRYDLAGQLTDVKSSLGNVTEYTYDNMGNLISKKAADGSETTYSYDLHNNLISLTSPDGTVESFIYDVSSRIEKAVKPDGSVIEYNYDELNNLLSKSFSDESETVTYGYDAAGNRVTMDDKSGQTTYTYDVLGRVTSVTDFKGHTVAYDYDEYGRISKITYPEDRTVNYTYDLADRLITVDDSDSGKTEYTYDSNGNVLTCTRSSGIITYYEYDTLGQVISVVNSQGEDELSAFTYTYDGNGRIVVETARQDGNVSEKQFAYDKEGQLSGYTENFNEESSVTTYNYSSTGNRIAVTKGKDKSTVVYEYDDAGRLVKEYGDKVDTIEYTYDENGNMIEKVTGEQILTYSYDIENRLTAVRDGGALLMAASYDGDGNRTFQITRQTVEFKIDKTELEENAVNPSMGSTGTIGFVGSIPNSDVNTDNPQNDTSKFDDTTSVKQEEVNTYYEKVYVDPADTIFWYGFGQGILHYFGNINASLSAYLSDCFCHAWDFVTEQYTLELHSEVQYSDTDIKTMRNAGLSEEDIAEITGNEIDSDSNVIMQYTEGSVSSDKKTEANEVRSNEQSVNGESVIIPEIPDEVTRIDYDLIYYVNDINTANEQVLMTYGRNESEKAVYTYGVDRIIEDDLQSEQESDYLYDGRGSVVQTAVSGEVELSITYDPFGEIVNGVDDNFVGFAYNGEEYNKVTGLQYLRARYYDNDIGSFITIDSYLGSLNDVASQNRYTYAENDPVNNIDPSGHYSVNVNGTSQYYTSTGLNEMRDFMTAAGLWAGQVQAQNGFNSSVARANNTSFMNYQNISGISQATANNYMDSGVAKAGQVSMNYGCSVPTVGNQAVAKFTAKVNAAKNSANQQIDSIKASKKAEYDAYQNYLKQLEEQMRIVEEGIQSGEIDESIINLAVSNAISQDPSVAILVEKIKAQNNGTLVGYDWSKLSKINAAWGLDLDKFSNEFFIADTTFEAIVNEDALTILVQSLKTSISNSVRPNNIGKGIWAKQIRNDLQWVDDVLGTTSKIATAVKVVPYAAVALDVGIGIYDNVQSGASMSQIIPDAGVDAAFGLGGIVASTLTGMAAGAVAGTVVPGIGNVALAVVGGIGGLVGGIGYYFATEVITWDGKSAKEHVKDWARGWFN